MPFPFERPFERLRHIRRVQPFLAVGNDGRGSHAPFAGSDFLDQNLAPGMLLAKRNLAAFADYFYESFHTVTRRGTTRYRLSPCAPWHDGMNAG